ncbi:hypothetical protein RvVAR0630_14110 [Agrobacterium vitis]|nr:hypothetical protein RvVAR0630_14110 [Agrobacterium vitis]
MLAFAVGTNSARNDADLDKAAKDLADAVTILGVDVVLGLLLKGKPKGTFKTTFLEGSKVPSYGEYARVMRKAGPTRMYEARLIFTRKLYAGQGGTRLGDNRATIGRNFYPESKPLAGAITDLRKTVYHERVHQRLTQALSLLGRPALYSRMSAYKRSYILRYIEEAAAESYGLAKTQGLRNSDYAGIQFPLNGKYGITVLDMKREAQGILLGPVTVGGATMNAYYGLIEDAR